MSLSVYRNPYSDHSNTSCELSQASLYPTTVYPGYEGSLVDPTVPGNRLIQHPNGSIELVPKSPAEVVGERLLRPFIDTVCSLSSRSFQVLRRGAFSLDRVLSNAFNFFPVAEAASDEDDVERKEQSCQEFANKLHQAVQLYGKSDTNFIRAYEKALEKHVDECYKGEDYKKAEELWKKYSEEYQRENKKFEDALKECQKSYSCYHSNKDSKPPEILLALSGEKMTWRATRGHLYWEIYIDRSFRPDLLFAHDSYNYDEINRRPNKSDL